LSTKSTRDIEDIKDKMSTKGDDIVMNCWEFKKCGREKGGAKVHELGVCPAYPNHGKHCAHVAGTLCEGTTQGTFAMKLVNCMQCNFYKSADYDKSYTQKLKK